MSKTKTQTNTQNTRTSNASNNEQLGAALFKMREILSRVEADGTDEDDR